MDAVSTLDAVSITGTVIAWAGFFGAWLLFAGPVYQAALELREQEIQRTDLERASENIEPATPVSAWWWLLPPVKLVLERRHENQFRQRVLDALDVGVFERLVNYANKALGWLLVGTGGLLIAAKETWELVEHEEWPWWLFWVLVVLVPVLCASSVAARISGGQKLLDRKRASSGGAGSGGAAEAG